MKKNDYIHVGDIQSPITLAYLAINTELKTEKSIRSYWRVRYKSRILLVSSEDDSDENYEFISIYYFWPSDFNYAFCVFASKGKLIRFDNHGAVFLVPSMFRKVD